MKKWLLKEAADAAIIVGGCTALLIAGFFALAGTLEYAEGGFGLATIETLIAGSSGYGGFQIMKAFCNRK